MRKTHFLSLVLMVIAFSNYCRASETSHKKTSASSETLPSLLSIGINRNDRTVIPAVIVLGAENGRNPINLDQWLIPFNAVTSALQITVRYLDNEQIELRSPEIVTQLSEQQLQKNKELGVALSVADIKRLFNIQVSFDMAQYVLVLQSATPAAEYNSGDNLSVKKVMSFTGLETLKPDSFNFSAISQQLRVSGHQEIINYSGDLLAVGNLNHGSWYMDINQNIMEKTSSWRFRELQYFWKSDETDYALGSQPTFWQNKSGGDFWGTTILRREGFQSVQPSFGGFDPFYRRTTNTLGRTITGEAMPNTLVRLVERMSNRVVGEVLVNSSGIYTFDNVTINPVNTADYEILLYPNGILTVEPQRINTRFVSRSSQLQKEASAWIVSAGVSRSSSNKNGANNIWGQVAGFAGGTSYRYGLTESLTLGAGLIYDQSFQSLAEFVYSPSWLPVYASMVAMNDFKTGKFDYNAQAQLCFQKNFTVSFNANQLTKQLALNWSPWYWLNFSVGSAINSSTTTTVKPKTWFVSGNTYQTFYDIFTLLNISFNSNSILRLNSLVYKDNWTINYQHDEIRNQLDLTYNFSDSSYARGNYGYSVNIGLDNNKATTIKNDLGILKWRYRSENLFNDGRSLIDTELGYGVGSHGQGFLAKLSTVMIPGVELSFNYQDISAFSKERQFFLNVSTNFRVQPNLSLSNRAYTLSELRGRGGIFIQPFLDKNDNGKLDSDESIYTENAENLFQLDGYPISKYNIEVGLQGLYIRQNAGKYRLDLDPSGHPMEGKPNQESYAIEVNPGAYTTVLIPFSVAYTIAGRVVDAQGNPIGGVKVEALLIDKKGNKNFTVSNGAGVFFIDNLHQGKYQLLLDNQLVHIPPVEIKSDSKTMIEVTLKK